MNLLLAPSQSLWLFCLWVSAAVLLAALRWAPWSQLAAKGIRQHAFFATAIVLGLFWLLQVELRGTLAFHPMLMTVVTMVFGWHLALVVGAAALLLTTLYRWAWIGAVHGSAEALLSLNPRGLPVAYLLTVILPVCWAWLMIRWVNRWSFKNPFTYFLGVGFFGAMLSCLWLGLVSGLLLALPGNQALLASWWEYKLLFVLMMFPEGFCNGAVATVLTVLWPELVKTYRDDWFLGDKDRP